MTDNVGYTPGSGETIASDDVGGVQFQRMKLALGADGVHDGDVSGTNPMPTRDDESRGLLFRILGLLMAPLGYDKSLQRTRGTVVVDGELRTIH